MQVNTIIKKKEHIQVTSKSPFFPPAATDMVIMKEEKEGERHTR